ncbi:putative pentatricopeptide repeat-containing protein At1g69350, mitochondrial [Rutidosis leptorrhynchoides]|uniref:putative pentatricopeptide repeat-containing protein At1g69350, mitochondrial n=1 Tax=Rutidosis leptorrhynchoides TaxID=125765 RepID=UPI003A9A2511
MSIIFRRTSIFSGKPKLFQVHQSFSTTPHQYDHTNAILPLCNSTISLHQTKQSHAIAITTGYLPTSITISAALILQYATFQNPSSSHILFHQSLPYSNSSFLYNTVIRAYSIAGVYNGFQVYNLMMRNGVKPDDHTYPFVLKVCTDYNEVPKGKEVHGAVWKSGFGSDVFVGNTLLRFYGECCGVGDAEKVFDKMSKRDVVSWNTLISVCSVVGCNNKAIELFKEMRFGSRSGCFEVEPNVVTIVSLLPVCAAIEDCVMTNEVHGYAVKMGFGSYVTINNAFIDAYGKCGDLKSCKQGFDEMVERNDVSWNAMITSFSHMDRQQDGMDFFRSMVEKNVVPNSVAVSSMLPILVELECLQWGIELHGFSIRIGMDSDIFVANSLLDMYAKFGYSAKASNVFKNIESKNIVSWNALVANYAQNGFETLALHVVREMQDYGQVPGAVTLTNVLPACARIGIVTHGKQVHARSIRMGYACQLFISNALIDMYAKCGHLDLARKVFDISCKDRISYNTLISAYSHTNTSFESLVLFCELLSKGLKPDTISFASALSACANMAEIKNGKEIHGVCVRTLFHNHLIVSNSVMDLYTKCGRIDLAQKVFDRIPNKDVASWNTMIMGYGMRGELDTAISLFEVMKNDHHVKCDSITYIAVLSVCSHGGMVDLGRKYFTEMKEDNVEPTQTHYACMVDLLGRAGLMDEAVEMINGSETELDANAWGSLLGACRIHGNIELGQWASQHLFKLKPGHSGYYTLLSNMYAEAGRWNEADNIRGLMKLRGVKKNPGFSSL